MTKAEALTELNNRIATAKVSGFWTDIQKKGWIVTAVKRVCDFRRWRFLELARSTYTKKDHEYYDYPNDIRINSIYYMEVDGKEYIKKNWDDYQEYKVNGSSNKIFTSHDGFFFINPIPTENNKIIDIWGIKKTPSTVGDDEELITPSEFDEAVIKLALATCYEKAGEYDKAIAERAEVETAANPKVKNSGGILAKLADREEDEGTQGYIGKAQHVRFMH